MAWAFKHVYWFNPKKVHHGTCAMERLVQNSMRRNKMMIGRALCRADWAADWLTGSLANWFGVFPHRLWVE